MQNRTREDQRNPPCDDKITSYTIVYDVRPVNGNYVDTQVEKVLLETDKIWDIPCDRLVYIEKAATNCIWEHQY